MLAGQLPVSCQFSAMNLQVKATIESHEQEFEMQQ